jgi:hypothetical protein
MPDIFSYPNNFELNQIAQNKIPAIESNRVVFDFFPIRDVMSDRLVWEQMDNFTGLQQPRGLDGDPPRVKKTGAKGYDMEPGVYGEYELISEREMTKRRPYGQIQGTVSLDDLVMPIQDKLLGRRYDRIEWIVWQLLITGAINVAGVDGSIIHSATFSPTTFTASPLWSVPATSHPIADLRAVQLLSRGVSASFGPDSTLYLNRTTSNNVLSNTNANDLGGRRVTGLSPVNSIPTFNQILQGENLPQISVYDEGYLDDTGTFQNWIPDGKFVLVGRRPANQPVGEYRMTRNACKPGFASGAYQYVVDSLTTGRPVPRRVEVHDGHNGGPVLYFPSSIVVGTV